MAIITNLLTYLEETAERVPDKMAFAGETQELTFAQVLTHAKATGSALAKRGFIRQPVVVFMQKTPAALTAFFGVWYSGSFYVVLDEEMPRYRMELILERIDASVMICDEQTVSGAKELGFSGTVLLYEELIHENTDEGLLEEIRSRHLDTDPAYAVFTSGSTGVPKGVLTAHRSVIDYMEQLANACGFDEHCIFANQAPFYFDAPMKEIGAALKFGATVYLVPKQLFMFPVKLMEYLNEHHINTICWAASALSLVSSMKTFDKVVPEYLEKVIFVGEVFPVKQLTEWQRVLPDAMFVNLYGPTEATGVSCYYVVNRAFSAEETLPVGKPFSNTEILLLGEDGTTVSPGEVGEICIRGTCLALGYYKDPEKTAECFVQNPLQPHYPDRIYKTGDLGRWNAYGELEFVSRADSQIKHMGHRIELGEIEVVTGAMEGVLAVCCLFDQEKKKIVLFYTGETEKAEVASYIRQKLPRYMLPSYYEKLEQMPYTPNGKTDRMKLKERYETCKN